MDARIHDGLLEDVGDPEDDGLLVEANAGIIKNLLAVVLVRENCQDGIGIGGHGGTPIWLDLTSGEWNGKISAGPIRGRREDSQEIFGA